MTDDLQKRSIAAMESIAKSLSVIANDVEKSKAFRKEMDNNISEMEKILIDMRDDPFGTIKSVEAKSSLEHNHQECSNENQLQPVRLFQKKSECTVGDLIKETFPIFLLGIVVGCMLAQLGITL